MATEITCCSAHRSELGEGPLWDPETQTLFTLDCMSRKLLRWSPDGHEREYPLKRTPGSFALRVGAAGMLMANRRSLALLDLETGSLEDISTPAVDFDRELFNDGKCDRRGRFWVGTMDRETARPVGGLYRVTPDLRCERMDDGITLSNGIAWSPDDRTMYLCDSRPGHIWAYDYDLDAGVASNRRMHVDFSSRAGRPDGCTVDTEGGLWVAEIAAGQVVRFAPDGRETAAIRVPVSRPTSVMFGGADLRTLFITSMRHGLSDAERQAEPLAGATFAVNAGVAGLPEPRFAG